MPAAGKNQNLIVPNRGRGVLQQQQPGMRTPLCGACSSQIRCKDKKEFPVLRLVYLNTLRIQRRLFSYFDRNHLRQKCSHSLLFYAFVKIYFPPIT